jgi:hypothetical protein
MQELTRLEKVTCDMSAVVWAGVLNPHISFLQYLGTAFTVTFAMRMTIWWVKNWTGGDL